MPVCGPYSYPWQATAPCQCSATSADIPAVRTACVVGGGSHQSFVPTSAMRIWVIWRPPLAPASERTKTAHRSPGDAESTGPSALPASNVITIRFSAPRNALSCRSGRAHPARPTSERRAIGLRTAFCSALPALALAAQRASKVAASHVALDGAAIPIETARTHTHATTTGAVAVFPSFFEAIMIRSSENGPFFPVSRRPKNFRY